MSTPLEERVYQRYVVQRRTMQQWKYILDYFQATRVKFVTVNLLEGLFRRLSKICPYAKENLPW